MLSILLFFVCLLCSIHMWLKYFRVQLNAHALPPPVPGKLPVIGHALILLKYGIPGLWDLMKYLSENCVKQGGVTYFNYGTELYYLIVDPQDSLTAANLSLQKHYAFDYCKVWVGDGLLTSSGETWKRHRKMLTPAFSLPVIHSFLDVFNSQSKRLLSILEPNVGKGLFDQSSYLRDNALETLCVGILGINPVDDKNFIKKYMEYVQEMLLISQARAVKFWLQSDLVYWLTGLKKKEDEVVNTLHSMVNKVLQKKTAAMKDKDLSKTVEAEIRGIKYKPLLDLLLDLSTNNAITEREIREELDTFIAAGFETTSNQLTFTLLLLGAHPEVQEKLYAELLEILGPDRDVEKDNINKLVYTNAVLMESLRVIPSVPVLLRSVDKDVKLKNYTMRAGSHCIIFPLATHLDPSWGPESDKFRPERWLHGDLRNNKEFAAFGLGKRYCIGRTYAMITMKVTLAHFLRRYKVKADMRNLKLKYEFVTKSTGHEISIERRN